MFFGCTVPPDSKETEHGSNNEETSPSAGKNTGIVLVSYRSWKCVPTAISGGTDISKVCECPLLRQMSSQRGWQKLLQGLVSHELTSYLSISNVFLTQWIMGILSIGCKPNNFEPHNSLKHSFTNIRILRSNFVECESFLESSSPKILALYETDLDDSVDPGNFSVRGYLSLIQKDSITHMHCMVLQFM